MYATGRTPLHYVFEDGNTIPLTRDTAALLKKSELIAKEIQQEKDKQEKLSSYADQFDLKQHANNHTTSKLNAWLKHAKLIRLNRECDKQREKNEMDHEALMSMSSQEKDQIRTYCTYQWEAENGIPERFDPIDIFKFLLSYPGLRYDQLDKFKKSPLHYAASVGAFSCSTLLISKGIDINAVDSDNVSYCLIVCMWFAYN